MTAETKTVTDISKGDLSIRNIRFWEKTVGMLSKVSRGTKFFRDTTDDVITNFAHGEIGEKHASLYMEDIFIASKFAAKNMNAEKDKKNLHELQNELRRYMVQLGVDTKKILK
jgi:hypothetical protein